MNLFYSQISKIKNHLKYILILLTISALTSCASTKKTASYSSSDKVERKNIEHKLGFTVPANDPNKTLYAEAASWIGVPYKYGGMTKRGTDCSGLTFQLHKSTYNTTLRRTAAEMARYNVKTIKKNELMPGDLVFFATSNNKKEVTHVGVYLKDNFFIHASSIAGVVVNNLNEDYYKKRLIKCGRVK